jgi:hypothetical protein
MQNYVHSKQWQDYNMATLLARRAGQETPIATDDDHHEALSADPTVSAFPQGSTFGDTNAFTNSPAGSTAFGSAPSTGFSSPSSFGAPASTSSSSFGASAPAVPQSHFNQADAIKSSGGAMQEGAEALVAHDKDSTDWINKKWRPVMGWVYMMTCTADFVVFPILWSLLQALSKGNVTSQWMPLTLQGAGLYHIAMGAVLGIAAYGRTKEKVAGAA